MSDDFSKMKDADMPLLDRIEAALDRITNRQGLMRIPREATDIDVVVLDCGDEIKRLRAENAALKANDPLAEMWRELAEYQPMADADGYGEAWAKMCSERTKQAARDAGFAAHAVAVGSRTQLAKLAAHDARDSTLFAGWASGNYVEGLKAVAEDCHSAIDAIRRAKEAKS